MRAARFSGDQFMKNKSHCPCFGEQAVNYNSLPFGTFTGGGENNGPLSAEHLWDFSGAFSCSVSVLLNVKARFDAGPSRNV